MESLAYGLQQSVAVFAVDADGLAQASTWVVAAGARTGVRGLIADAVAMEGEFGADAVLVHARAETGDALGGLLDRLNAAAASGRHASVVVLDEAAIDFAAVHAAHADVALVCGFPIEAEAVAALCLALPQGEQVLRERDETPAQLRRLHEEVSRIARALAEMSGEEPLPRSPPLADPPRAIHDAPLAPLLRSLLRARRIRDEMFPGDLFADPAWDMLLDLMLARVEGRMVAVSSLCIAAAVPPTTALRWIKRLTDEGLFIRSADPRDGRRIFIDLAEGCAQKMTAYLRALPPV